MVVKASEPGAMVLVPRGADVAEVALRLGLPGSRAAARTDMAG